MKPLPMLATPGQPFDSEDYLFEVKWDGVRALAAVEQGSWSVWGRHGVDYTARYPELAVLRRLPHGTVVDGVLAFSPALGSALRQCGEQVLQRADRWCGLWRG